MAYFSTNQIILSTKRLSRVHPFFGFAFLAFKKGRLPVGRLVEFKYTEIQSLVLEPYFKPVADADGFFTPFAGSNPKRKWVSDRYVSTSLQRIISDTFADAFMHAKGSSQRGWAENYVSALSKLLKSTKTTKIPIVDLGVWLYRNESFNTNSSISDQLYDRVVAEFNITDEELSRLCVARDIERTFDLASETFDLPTFLNVFGWPDKRGPSLGTSMSKVELRNVGPTEHITYEPSPRLNLIVGDNSLGKTFMLDILWWSLTSEWSEYAAEPKDRNDRKSAEIVCTITDRAHYRQTFLSLYDPASQAWQRKETSVEGFGIYARHDGSISIWDPLRTLSRQWRGQQSVLNFDRKEIWGGRVADDAGQRPRHICNGLVRDLVSWQTSKQFSFQNRLFKSVLRTLAAGTEISGIGDAVTVPEDSRLVPTIRMPYGNIPIVYASAGVRRVLSIAYLLVWAWSEHLQSATYLRRKPYSQVVLIFDELEAHLHPKWQRTILPALLKLTSEFGADTKSQIHVATHSPLVLASAEPTSDQSLDTLHLLQLNKTTATLDSYPFQKRGTIDAWLTSEFFDLDSPRNNEAENAIIEAKRLQTSKRRAAREEIDKVHERLLRVLPDDDQFWIRWNFFREKGK